VASADAVSPPSTEKANGKYWVFLGTSGGGSKGIYRFELDAATGKASNLELAGEATNPGFLAIHPSGKFLYAVGDIHGRGGKRLGGVLAFALDSLEALTAGFFPLERLPEPLHGIDRKWIGLAREFHFEGRRETYFDPID